MSLRDELVQVLLEMSTAGSQPQTNANIIRMWQQYMARFSALLAPYLVNTMLIRSLEKHRDNFPWLPSIRRNHSRIEILKLLEESLSAQSCGEVDRVTRALLSTHIDMLFEMVGKTLTMQLVCGLASQPPPKGLIILP